MESVKKAKDRFRQYPLVLSKCKNEAGNYAKCVLKKDSVNMNDCLAEFNSFKNCLQKAAVGLRTRI
ncbi:hypothetical protein RN001_015330 [Aquatica leii]|uniref:Uncharacterized protein n=1 Tax=Aquatica leii TaxID=1421715 RepID=A0AAN7S6L7_9COLE|nr:hypothetical protein RN001_015330 [Aquatica leii]